MSGKTKPAHYTWFPADYEADENVKLMTHEQEGIYRRLLDHQAMHGSIPSDIRALAALLGKGLTAAKLKRLWPGIAPCWKRGAGGRLVNGRLARDRQAAADFSEQQRKLALLRWQKERDAKADANADAKADAKAMPPEPLPLPYPSERRASESITPHGARALGRKAVRSRERNDRTELPGSERPPSTGKLERIGDITPWPEFGRTA